MQLRTLIAALAALFLLSSLSLAQTPAEAPADASPDEAVERLLDILQDDAARAALVERLQAEQATPAEEPETNVAQQVAEATVEFADEAIPEVRRAWREIARLSTLFERLMTEHVSTGPEAAALAMTILATVSVSLALGLVTRRIALRLSPKPLDRFPRRARSTGLVFLSRLVALLLAWSTGYALATFVFSETNTPSQAQVLYLNAFAVFGLFRVLLRVLASPDADREPSLATLAPGAQATIYRNLRAVAGVVVQGSLFLAPLSQLWLGFAVARPLRTLVATLAALLALLAIRRISRALHLAKNDRPLQTRQMGEAGAVMAKGASSLWRRVWPPVAVIYVLYAWFIAVTRPNLVDEIVLGGTLYTFVALLLLLVSMRLLDAAPSLKAPLPGMIDANLPRLGPRANRIFSIIGWVGAFVLALAALALVFQGWEWVDVGAFIARSETQAVLWRIASAFLVALVAAIVWAVVASWLDRKLNVNLPGAEVDARSRTLLALFRNAFTIVIAVLALMITLSQLGIDIAPLLAGAGVLGLAIGFGAQKLVQDIITGIFIQLENAMNEGDVVGVGGITGVVEKITIRSARLRTLDGAVHVIPFSSVDLVSNLTRDFSYHVAEIGVAYKEKVPAVKEAMEEAFKRLKAEGFDKQILEPLEMHGVTTLGDSSVVVRARIKTLPGQQWGTGRRYTELVKEVLDERGIEIPFPHRQLVFPERFALPALEPGAPNAGTKAEGAR